ncbi:MAG: DNA-directed RNA polymerases I, II, and III subunit RPABC3 [Trichoglossum hirsutum]|nr:MAG: DNA-directed RNA polymerases I, II, and III subunit RPABC3 [Trichoglossum hirsutum]
MSADAQLFDDTFNITAVDSQKYDRVSRLTGISTGNDITMTLDVNTELYPCSIGDTLQLVLASTLSLDGSKDDGKGWRIANEGETSLADIFDYVCHGSVQEAHTTADGLRLSTDEEMKKRWKCKLIEAHILRG